MTRSLGVREDVEIGVTFFNVNASSSAASPSAASPFPAPLPSPLPAGGSPAPYFARSFNSNVVVAMVVLILAVVVSACVNTVVRVVLRRRRWQRDSAQQQQVEAKGLDPGAIQALPVVTYGADSRFSDNVDCVVCLSEFLHREELRMLPECQHAFHVACIDAWLVTHQTCPVCRQSVTRSARFGSARIASVDTEAAQSDASASSHIGSRSFRSIFPSETVAMLVHGALGSRRFGLRSQGG